MSKKLERYLLKGKRIIITGTSGFIGKNLIKSLALNNDIIGIQLELPEAEMKYSRVEYIIKDLCTLSSKDFPKNIDLVIHLAAKLDNPLKEIEPSNDSLFEVNVRGTYVLLEIAKQLNIPKFVYGSSAGVYGFGEKPFKESDLINSIPINFYILTKMLCEKMCQWYSQFIDITILRYGVPYGPDTSNPLFKYLIEYSLRNNIVDSSFKCKSQYFNPVYIDDAVKITEHAATLKGYQVINVGGPDIISPIEIVEHISNIMGKKKSHTVIMKKKEEEIRKRILDISKLEKILKYKFKFNMAQGIVETMKFYKGKNL